MAKDKKHALVIGINHYFRCNALNYCEKDAEEIAKIFSTELEIEPDNVILLSSSAKDERKKPLKLNIFHAIAEIQKKAEKGEVESIYLYFAGHGYRESGHGWDYLLPQDGTLNALQDSGLAIADICKRLASLNTNQVVFFLDACREELESGQRSFQSSIFGEDASEVARNYGVVIFFSCSPGEVALESSKIEHGVFTYSLLKALMSKNIRTVTDINNYLVNKMPSICKDVGMRPFTPYTSVAPLENANLVICPRRDYTPKRHVPDKSSTIIIIGPSNSGKTTIGKWLASYTGRQHVELSDYVWNKYNSAKETGSIIDFVDNIWRTDKTKTIFADELIEEHEKNKLGPLVICGPRCDDEVARLKQYFKNAIVIGIEADASKRFKRLKIRKRDRYTMTMEEFLLKDYREYSWGMSLALGNMTDFLIVNNGTLKELNETLIGRCKVRGLLKIPNESLLAA